MHSNRVTKTLSFFSKSLLSILLLTVFFAPLAGLLIPVAQAQSVLNANATSDANNQNISPTATGATTPGQGGTVTTPSAGQSGGSGGSGNNGEISDSCWKSSWAICFSNVVYVFTVGLMSIFAYIGAFVFDTAIQITLQSVTYSQYFLTQSWAAVRDLANMIFIFLLVYLAITVILQAETQGTMKMLAGIIIAALLINFSFFFTRLVIDGGNLLALQFYNAIEAPSLTESAQNSTGVVGTSVTNLASHLTSNGSVKDLTRGIMDVIGVQSLVGSGSFSQFAKQENVGFWTVLITLTFVYIAVAAILAMLAFTFIAVGVKFIVRIVVLWLTIIASPLAFVLGAIYDRSKADRFKVRERWLGSLIEYSFYPAVFLFLFWIINFFANGLSSGGSVLTAALQEASGASGRGAPFVIASVVAGISIRLGIIIALMYMAMRVSDSFAKTGYKAFDSTVSKYGGKVGGWVVGAAALAGRNTAGRAGYTYAQSNTGRRVAAENPVLGRALWKGANKLGAGTYDMRNSTVGKKIGSSLPGGGIGSGTSKTYGGQLETKVKRRVDEAKKLTVYTQTQLNDAYKKVIGSLSTADRGNLLALSQQAGSARAEFEAGSITEQVMKQRQAAFNREVGRLSGLAKKEVGSGNDQLFANSLEESSSPADREAVARIRQKEGDADRLRAALAAFPAVQNPAPQPPPNPAPQNPQQPPQQGPQAPAQQPPQRPNQPGGGAGPQQQGGGGGVRPYRPIINLNDPLGFRQQRALRELRTPNALGDSIGVRERGSLPIGSTSTSAPLSENGTDRVTSQEITDQTRALNTSINEQTSRVTGAIENLQSNITSTAQTQQRETIRANSELQADVRNVADEVRQLRRTTTEGTVSLRESLVQPTISLHEQPNSTLSTAQRNAIQAPSQTEPIRAIPRTHSTPPTQDTFTQNIQPKIDQGDTQPNGTPENNLHN